MNTQPHVVLTSVDVERIERLLEKTPPFPGRDKLEEELARADISGPDGVPGDVVTMNSTVCFTVSGTAERFCRKLVYPHDHTSEDTISILAPVGSALLGLAEGDEIEWPRPGGGTLTVRITEVRRA